MNTFRGAAWFAATLGLLVSASGCDRTLRAVATGDPGVLLSEVEDPQKLLAAAPARYRVFDPQKGGEVWRDSFVRALIARDYDLLILGEMHDNPTHHQLQAWLVETLNQLRPRTELQPTSLFGGVQGLAFEMMPEGLEREINAARPWRPGIPRPGKVALANHRIAEILDWRNSGWPDWAHYAPILAAAPQAYIAGGEVPRDSLMSQAKAGAESAPQAARFGLDRPLDAREQELREALQIKAHCDAIPAAAASSMVAAQRIRDASLTAALLRAEDKGNGFSVLITGNGHGRTDWAVPRMARRAAPSMTVISVAMIEAAPGARISPSDLAARFDAAQAPYDYVIVTAPPSIDRGDPCAAFR